MGWNGIEMSYSVRQTAEEYEANIRKADFDFMAKIVQEITNKADREIKEKEETREYFSNLVVEIASRTDTIIKTNNAERQSVPYTVNLMSSMLLGAVEGHFLQRDNGEKRMEENLAMQEDPEPEPSLIDSWAAGSVPVRRIPKAELETAKPLAECKNERRLKDWEIEFRYKYLSSPDTGTIKANDLAFGEERPIPIEIEKKETDAKKKTSFVRKLFGRKKRVGTKTFKHSRFSRMLAVVFWCIPRSE